MSTFKAFLAIGVIAVASLVVGYATPVSADPTGTLFGWTADNFQGDDPGSLVPFGVPTSTPSGVTVDSSVSISPAIPSLTVGGLDYVEFSMTTDDGGFLADSLADNSAWFITGLSWGPGSPPGVGAGWIFLSFDSDGTYLPLDGTAFGIPIVPNPGTFAGVTGAPAIPLDFSGNDVSLIPFDVVALTSGAATSLGTLLIALGMDTATALSVTSMHVGFEVAHIPEPATVALLGVGLCSTLLLRRRK
ncbi:MAG: PEP-CTERM sorting domain-containing protein [Pirellulales bacterium]